MIEQLVAALLVGLWNVGAAYAERPFVPLLSRYVPVAAGKSASRALHLGVGVLYAATVVAFAHWSGPLGWAWVLFGGFGLAARAAIFEPVLENGKPGRVWGNTGESALYDRLRRWIAARLGWPVQKVGGWSNIIAAVVAAACLAGNLWLINSWGAAAKKPVTICKTAPI